MGDDAVIVRGVSPNAVAVGKRNRKTGKVLTPGRVSPEMMQEWVVVMAGENEFGPYKD